MVNSPIGIRLALSPSRQPSDLVKIQAIAADALKIEHYINSRMDKEYIQAFDFTALAVELSIDRERVCALLGKLASSDTAITICNRQKTPKTPPARRTTSCDSIQSNADVPAWIAPSSMVSEVSR